MKKIDKLVKEKLHKRYDLNESFQKIMLTEDRGLSLNMTVGKLGQLIDEGYDEEQFNQVIEEQLGDWFKSLFNANQGQIQQQNKGSLPNTALSAGRSQFQEWIIGKFLNILGLEGKMADFVATTLSEVGIMELINMFRGQYGCQKTSTILVNSVGEGLFRIAVDSGLKQNGLMANYIRNVIMEYMKSEGYTQKIANTICKMIEKNKPSILKGFNL